MKIEQPNLVQDMLLHVENQHENMMHLASLAKKDKRFFEFLEASISGSRKIVLMLVERVWENEDEGKTQSKKDEALIEYSLLQKKPPILEIE